MSILAAIDFSDAYQEIIEQAITQSKAFSEKLYLIHVENPSTTFVSEGVPPQYIAGVSEDEFQLDKEKLEKLVEDIKARGVEVDYFLEKGITAIKIIEKAKLLQVKMIVIGSHGHAMLMDMIKGSTHEGVLHKADCPVLVIPIKK
ncbi:MAG: universal stress protein [Calditrichia bacterium]|nr:universal stress protein [Calditrichia bacterium]